MINEKILCSQSVHEQITKVYRHCKATSISQQVTKRKNDLLLAYALTIIHPTINSFIKTCQVSDIPTKVIKINKDIFANIITDHFNYCIANGEFPDELKHADVIPVHKKNEKCNKT